MVLLFPASATKTYTEKWRRESAGVTLDKYFSFLSTLLFIVPAGVFTAFEQKENVPAKGNQLY